MEIITSTKNPIVAKTIKIKLDEMKSQLFLENTKLIREAIISGLEVEYFLVEKSKYDYFKGIFGKSFENKLYIVSSIVINKVCDTKTPQGIVAVVNYKGQKLGEISSNFLVLDSLQDPGNVGTIIRSASGTSFRDIILINCVNFLDQKVVRSTMGGIFKQNLYAFKTREEFLTYYKTKKYPLYVADMQGENLFNFKKPSSPYGVIVGNEGKGVCEELKVLAMKAITIPMKNGLESLNVGVSCSIIIYYLDNLK